MSAFTSLTAVLNLDSSGFQAGVDSAQTDLGKLEDRATSTGRSMQRVGAGLTAGVTAPLTAMGAMSVRVAGNFDEAMQQSIAVMGDVDDAMRENLEETAREVARTTTHSASEAAEAFYFLASAGLDATESMEAMPEVSAFAESGQMNLAEATDVATNVMSAYGIEAENMADVTDTMVATTQNHNQTMEGMSAAFKNAAPAAASMGVELEELAGMAGALGDVGVQGAESGTAINSIMRRMARRTGEAGNALDELGVQTVDANGDLLPMVEIIGQLEDANLSSAQSAAIFGEQMSAGNALVSAGADELKEYQSAIADSEGANQKMAETQRDTLNAEMAMARSNVEDVGIAIGADLLPMLSTLTGYVSSAAERFQNLSEGQRRAMIATAGVAAAIGPLLILGGTFLTMLPAMATGVGMVATASTWLTGVLTGGVIPAALATQVALGPVTVPIWAIIGAVGAMIAVGYGLYRAWTDNLFGVRDTTVDTFETVRGWFDAAPGWVLVLMGPIGQLYYAWRENLFGIQDIVGNVFDWIGRRIGWLLDQLERLPGIGGGDEAVAVEVDDELGDDVDVDAELFGGEEPETAGQQAGQSYASGFNDSLLDDIGVEDVEDELQSDIDSLQEEREDLRADGMTENLDERRELASQQRDLEDKLDSVRGADDVSEIDAELVADAAETQIKAEQEEAARDQEILDLLGERDLDIDEQPEGENQQDIDPEALATEAVEKRRSKPEQSQSEELVGAFKKALDEVLDGRELTINQVINERTLNDLIDDRVDAKVT